MQEFPEGKIWLLRYYFIWSSFISISSASTIKGQTSCWLPNLRSYILLTGYNWFIRGLLGGSVPRAHHSTWTLVVHSLPFMRVVYLEPPAPRADMSQCHMACSFSQRRHWQEQLRSLAAAPCSAIWRAPFSIGSLNRRRNRGQPPDCKAPPPLQSSSFSRESRSDVMT